MNLRNRMLCSKCPLAWDLCLDKKHADLVAGGSQDVPCPSAKAMRRLIDRFNIKCPEYNIGSRFELMRWAAGSGWMRGGVK